MVEAGVPLRVITSAALPVNARVEHAARRRRRDPWRLEAELLDGVAR